MAAPRIHAYLDYRTFLRDWIADAKRQHPGYSYAAFAAAGGCSKAALANVLSGARHPRADTLDAFARAMGLTPHERNYLGLLAELEAAPDVARRREVLDQILATDRHQQVRITEKEPEGAAMRYFEHWYVPAIRELARLPGFRDDPDWIAATLRPPIAAEAAREALDTLFDLGFLGRDPEGRVVVEEIRVRTEPETWDHAAAHVHRHVVPHVLGRMTTDRAQEQHLIAATLTVPLDQLPEAKERLTAAVHQVARLGDDTADTGPRAVYLLGVQLLPLSEPLD